MANLLSRFNQTVIGSESKIGDYRSTISSTGDFKRIEGIETIINSWNNILVTPRRSYMFDPEYGSNLYKLVFEPADEKTQQQIIQETVETIRRYDNRARITDVDVEFFPNMKGFIVAIDVSYDGDTSQLQVVIDQNTYFQFYESTDSGS